MISEKIQLLGKYDDIPSVLTLKAIPTVSELEYVSSEDFEQTMLDKILPEAIEEEVNLHNLLEIDFQWVCRCLRLINYGPYLTVNRVFCTNGCGIIPGEARVDLRTVKCIPLPEDFTNDIVIKAEEFIDYDQDIHLHLPTIQEILNANKDKMFKRPDGSTNTEFARICYMITQVGTKTNVPPISIKAEIEKKLTSADYIVLKAKVDELTNYGLRAGGTTTCPKCKQEATYLSFIDDKFFRPTLGDLREGKSHRSAGRIEDVSTTESATV